MTNPSRPSRFGNLRALKERGEIPPAEESSAAAPETRSAPPQLPQEAAKETATRKGGAKPPRPQTGANAVDPPAKPGRPAGKRSDAEFRQVSALVRRDTYKATQRRLLDEEREFSELVESLLLAWLAGKVRA